MSTWLEDEPFSWWQAVWMLLAVPSLVIGQTTAREHFWGVAVMMLGVVGMMLTVARLRQLCRHVRLLWQYVGRNRGG